MCVFVCVCVFVKGEGFPPSLVVIQIPNWNITPSILEASYEVMSFDFRLKSPRTIVKK